MKHEPIAFAGMTRRKLIASTDKRSGSKFAVAWTLVTYVEWIEGQIANLKWNSATGPATQDERLDTIVGVSSGEEVHTVRLVSDGRHLHAYPVKDV